MVGTSFVIKMHKFTFGLGVKIMQVSHRLLQQVVDDCLIVPVLLEADDPPIHEDNSLQVLINISIGIYELADLCHIGVISGKCEGYNCGQNQRLENRADVQCVHTLVFNLLRVDQKVVKCSQ